MASEEQLSPEHWAVATFGTAELGDPRRTDRLVSIAAALAHDPAASLPRCMRTLSDTHAAYRWLDTGQISHEQVMTPHWMQTRQLASQRKPVLLIADTTELNYSMHRRTKGLGPVGQGKNGRGFYVHTMLAMDATTQHLLGCAYQEPLVRQPAPKGETRAQRRERPRESQIWERSVQQIGPAPSPGQWVHVEDRYSDIFTFWQTCEQMHCAFLVRAAQDRRVVLPQAPEEQDPETERLLHLARQLPAQGGRIQPGPAEHHRKARDAFVQISFTQVFIQPPQNGDALSKTAVKAWIVRAWEPSPPEGVEALDWILISSLPVFTVEDA